MIDRQKVLDTLPFLVWSSVLLLLWFKSFTVGSLSWFFSFVLPIYLVITSFIIVKYVEKQSVGRRFGLQTMRFLLFYLLALTTVAAIFLAIRSDWVSFFGVVFAPIPEEVFFRGYMLGRLTSGKPSKSKRVKVGFLLLLSAIFSLSHLFAGYALTDYLWAFVFGLTMGFLYWFTGSIVPAGVFHMAFNFSLAIKKDNFAPQPLWIALVIVPSILLFGMEWFRRKRKSQNGGSSYLIVSDVPSSDPVTDGLQNSPNLR